MQDQRGNPVGTSSEDALKHAETALWRMCSFFDAPLADLARHRGVAVGAAFGAALHGGEQRLRTRRIAQADQRDQHVRVVESGVAGVARRQVPSCGEVGPARGEIQRAVAVEQAQRHEGGPGRRSFFWG